MTPDEKTTLQETRAMAFAATITLRNLLIILDAANILSIPDIRAALMRSAFSGVETPGVAQAEQGLDQLLRSMILKIFENPPPTPASRT